MNQRGLTESPSRADLSTVHESRKHRIDRVDPPLQLAHRGDDDVELALDAYQRLLGGKLFRHFNGWNDPRRRYQRSVVVDFEGLLAQKPDGAIADIEDVVVRHICGVPQR